MKKLAAMWRILRASFIRENDKNTRQVFKPYIIKGQKRDYDSRYFFEFDGAVFEKTPLNNKDYPQSGNRFVDIVRR